MLKKLLNKRYPTKVIRENSKINVLVHNDLDGTGCLYLISKVFGEENISFIKTSYKGLLDNLNFLIEDLEKNNKEKLIVCDLGLNSYLKNKINWDKVKGKLIWLDHHQWDKETLNFVRQYGEVIVDTSKCATAVVFDYFKNTYNFKFSEFDERVVEIICDFDLWKMKEEISWKLSLALMDYDLEKYRLEKLNRGIIFDNELEKIYEKNEKKIKKLIETYKKRGIILEHNGERILLVFDDRNNSLFISHVFENLKKDYDSLILVTNTGRVSLRGKNNVLDIAKRFGGGGHIKAAGGFVNYPYIFRKINKWLFKLGIYPKKNYIINIIKNEQNKDN
jgi:oligoribonuclease NrnB/cAMP/cGMP phosphodiesterase (DHH superfamily)